MADNLPSRKIALVTGGSTGIGLAIAKRLAAEGMDLFLAARSTSVLENAADKIRAMGAQVWTQSTDVADLAQLRTLARRIELERGRIDVLVNNAGIETYREFHELELDEIERTIHVNLTAAIQLTRLLVPMMLRAGSGHIINISSTAGKHGPAFGAAYGASKAGLVSFAQSLRAEYANRGIRASVICPGFTHSGGMYERMKAETGRETPWYVGATTDDRVAGAVIRALRGNRAELIVNTPPLRPVYVLTSLFPSLGGILIRAASHRFLKRVAQSRPPLRRSA